MSPVVSRSGQSVGVIYTCDHPPPHVHVKRAENEARITPPAETLDDCEFKASETSAILD